MQRVGGIIQVQVDGVIVQAKGEFSYNLGRPKRSTVMGSDRPHGITEEPQVGFIEGEITDQSDLSLDAIILATNATVTLSLANRKTIALTNAHYAGDGTGNTGEGNVDVRWEGECEEIPA